MNDCPDFPLISEAGNQEFHIDEAALLPRACPIREVARGLRNPRGIEQLPDGSLLVAEAGTGTRSDGRVVRLEPCSNRYQFADVLLDGLPSVSMLPETKREEILGAAEIHRVGSTMLAMVIDMRGGMSTGVSRLQPRERTDATEDKSYEGGTVHGHGTDSWR
ncbi:MAG: hypothetical protein ACRDIB_01545 [Ardenticatenaceae bacterium]